MHRALWQRCIFRRFYRCRGCGQPEYVLRLLPFWLRDGLRGWGINLVKAHNVGPRVTDTVGAPENYLTSRQLGHNLENSSEHRLQLWNEESRVKQIQTTIDGRQWRRRFFLYLGAIVATVAMAALLAQLAPPS